MCLCSSTSIAEGHLSVHVSHVSNQMTSSKNKHKFLGKVHHSDQDQSKRIGSVGRGQMMGRHGGGGVHQESEMFPHHHHHHHHLANYTDSSTSSDRSLVSTFNSNHHDSSMHEDPENIWSLTNRITHDGAGKGRNPEYSGACCKGAHYCLGMFGAALVLAVCILITIETIRSVLAYNDDNSTDPSLVTQTPNTNGFG